jgi:hypothetical protein
MGEMRYVYNILAGKSECRRQLIRTRCTWEDNIRMDLREKGWEDVDWMHQAKVRDQQQQALVNTVINLWVPLKWRISQLTE